MAPGLGWTAHRTGNPGALARMSYAGGDPEAVSAAVPGVFPDACCHPEREPNMMRSLLTFLLLMLLTSCAGSSGMGGGGMGTDWGSGGMEMGVHLGGWGDGYGGSWGHAPTTGVLSDLDNDPHAASTYRNPLFSPGAATGYYHPAR